ncbi:MAG TPA: FAD-dependent oxidoreductase, partial [Acidobacteriota bacterium]|nr:FAD-dependent oxidoreductase [Acidobacteriota bacterium]
MAQTVDVVVVGGGIIGSSIALFLAESGIKNIVLLEKRFLAAGSSGKSGAILRQHYSHPVTVGMARESLLFYASFKEQWGHDIGFRRPGMVLLTSHDQQDQLKQNVQLQKSLGVQTEVLDRRGLQEIEPRGEFPEDSIGAWEPEAAYVQPVRTVFAMTEAART